MSGQNPADLRQGEAAVLMVVDDTCKASVGAEQEHAGDVVHGVIPVARHLIEPDAKPGNSAFDLAQRAGQAGDPGIEIREVVGQNLRRIAFWIDRKEKEVQPVGIRAKLFQLARDVAERGRADIGAPGETEEVHGRAPDPVFGAHGFPEMAGQHKVHLADGQWQQRGMRRRPVATLPPTEAKRESQSTNRSTRGQDQLASSQSGPSARRDRTSTLMVMSPAFWKVSVTGKLSPSFSAVARSMSMP